MIFGDCPYCGESVMIGVPEELPLPAFGKVDCDHCGKWFWERISRIDPCAYKQEDVVVDEDTMKIISVMGEKV